jgi:hypothetical protein
LPQQFNPVLPSPIRVSGFVWPQLGLSQLWLFIQIVFKRLGFIRGFRTPQPSVFDFCVSKPALESGARREEFSLVYCGPDSHDSLLFAPSRVWKSPLAVFMWVKHAASDSSIILCFPYSNTSAYRHIHAWLKFYKPSNTTFEQSLPLLGGLK